MIHVLYNDWARSWTEDVSGKDLNILHNDRTSSGTPTYYLMANEGSFPAKSAGDRC